MAQQTATRLASLTDEGRHEEALALAQQEFERIATQEAPDTSLIRQIQQKDGLSEGLRRRLSEMMIAMGVEPEPTDITPAVE